MSKSLVRKGIVFVKGAAGEGRASKERYSTEKEKERLHDISERGRPQAGKVRRRRRRGKSGLVTKDEDNGANSQDSRSIMEQNLKLIAMKRKRSHKILKNVARYVSESKRESKRLHGETQRRLRATKKNKEKQRQKLMTFSILNIPDLQTVGV